MTDTARRKIEYVDIDSVVPAERNPKRHDIDGVRRSMATLGYIDPVLHDERTGRLVGGHGRIEALQAMRDAGEPPPDGVVTAGGVWKVPMVRGWASTDDRAADAAVVALNRYVELGGWDNQGLVDLLRTLDGGWQAVAGYAPQAISDLEAFLAAGVRAERPDPDLVDVAPKPKKPKAKPGQTWLLGPHRVYCGDSTAGGSHTVMGGDVASMMWTDPPYGVDYVGGNHGDSPEKRRAMGGMTIANDTLQGDALRAFLVAAFTLGPSLRPGGAVFVAAPAGDLLLPFLAALVDLGIYRQGMVWVKDSLVMSRQDYHYRHEMILFGWKPGAGHHRPKSRALDSVWEIPRPKRSDIHPTMKPVALIQPAIENHTDPGEIVLDPFGGSGSTLIAADQCGRVARLVEKDPGYVDVIVRRWADLTGGTPKLLDG
jgi:DNA modification methylase